MSTTASETYRDATFSRETRDELARLLEILNQDYPPSPFHVAVKDVVDRWDANDATEFTM